MRCGGCTLCTRKAAANHKTACVPPVDSGRSTGRAGLHRRPLLQSVSGRQRRRHATRILRRGGRVGDVYGHALQARAYAELVADLAAPAARVERRSRTRNRTVRDRRKPHTRGRASTGKKWAWAELDAPVARRGVVTSMLLFLLQSRTIKTPCDVKTPCARMERQHPHSSTCT